MGSPHQEGVGPTGAELFENPRVTHLIHILGEGVKAGDGQVSIGWKGKFTN